MFRKGWPLVLNGRRQASIGVAIAAAVLTYVSAAFACGPVASLKLGSSAAPPGAQVNATGSGFSNSYGGAPSAEPVVVQWDSRTGPVLWSGRPDATGAISFTFTVPSAPPGDHNVIATQTNADGEPAPGTPARAVLTVLEPPPTTTTSTTTTTTTTTTVVAPPSSMPAVESATAPPATASTVPPSAAPTTVASVRQTATRATTTTAKSAATAPPSTDAIVVTAPPTTTPPTSLAPPSPDTSAPSGTALVAQEAFSDDGGSGTWTPVLLGVVLLGSLAASVGGMRRARARRSE